MADKEHAEWAANIKERKEALKKRLKTPPPAAAPEERPKSGGGDHDENERISLGM